jgi:hypothetical protein
MKDADLSNPADKGGSLESRMGICGGILRLLNGTLTVEAMKQHFQDTVSDIDFGEMTNKYFAPVQPGKVPVVHRLFACYPTSPFQDPGTLRFVSSFVESLVLQHVEKTAGNDRTREATENWIDRVLGLPRLIKGNRGGFFENLCLSRIAWSELGDTSPSHHIEALLWVPQNARRKNWPQIQMIDIPRIKRTEGDGTTIPQDTAANWLWVPNIPNFPAIDGILCLNHTVYLLQVTANSEHEPVTLTNVWPLLAPLRSTQSKIKFLVVVNCLQTLMIFLRRTERMLLVREGDWANMVELVGCMVYGRASDRPSYATPEILNQANDNPIANGIGHVGISVKP